MFSDVDLYEKLSGEKKKIVARVEGKYVDIRKYKYNRINTTV
jgi:hypothetical protein